MPRRFEDGLTSRVRGTRNARDRQNEPNTNSKAKSRGKKAKAQYTTVGGTPIIEGKPS